MQRVGEAVGLDGGRGRPQGLGQELAPVDLAIAVGGGVADEAVDLAALAPVLAALAIAPTGRAGAGSGLPPRPE